MGCPGKAVMVPESVLSKNGWNFAGLCVSVSDKRKYQEAQLRWIPLLCLLQRKMIREFLDLIISPIITFPRIFNMEQARASKALDVWWSQTQTPPHVPLYRPENIILFLFLDFSSLFPPTFI